MTSPRPILNTLVLSALLVAGCNSPDLSKMPLLSAAPTQEVGAAQVSTAEALAAFRRVGEANSAAGYRLGAGDLISVDVWGRADLSSKQAVGPDGTITLPVVGDLKLGGLDRALALAAVQQSFARAYQDLVITLRVDEYLSLSVIVVGQVNNPGVQLFDAPPDLLTAIGKAGGVDDPANGLTTSDLPLSVAAATRQWKAAVIRGRDAVLWVDLNALIREGDMSLNVPLIAGDVVHVAAEQLATIYVLGEVTSPGVYPLRQGATVIDALALAGGTTENSDDEEVRLLRPGKSEAGGFDYQAYQVGKFEFDRPLAAGDVVYVPTSVIGEIGYFLREISPLAQMLIFTNVVRN